MLSVLDNYRKIINDDVSIYTTCFLKYLPSG